MLTTLEAIYEESGEVESRIRILRTRLESADTEEMATTYRLLLAQLIWDEREEHLFLARDRLAGNAQRSGGAIASVYPFQH